jgi:site-specific recombinase XerD
VTVQANISLGTIQQLLGHRDITTNKIYVESIRWPEEVDEAADGLF